jgi:Uma2 family endonuclease
MTPLDPHEGNKKLLGRLVETLTEELNIEVRSLGSRTCQRQDLNRGFEPDQCYYIQNESLVWDKEQIDLQQDPPPDLIIEIDITSSSINQLELYRAFLVPEVWRYDGKNITFYQLEGESYRETDNSPTFPFLSKSDIMHFLELKKTTRENAWIGLFRKWVKSQIPTAN